MLHALQGTSELAVAQNHPRSSPKVYEEQDANLGAFIVHARNQTTWCWEAADVEAIFLPEGQQSSASAGPLPVWARWTTASGATLPLVLACMQYAKPLTAENQSRVHILGYTRLDDPGPAPAPFGLDVDIIAHVI